MGAWQIQLLISIYDLSPSIATERYLSCAIRHKRFNLSYCCLGTKQSLDKNHTGSAHRMLLLQAVFQLKIIYPIECQATSHPE
jgi:hypothetical protein